MNPDRATLTQACSKASCSHSATAWRRSGRRHASCRASPPSAAARARATGSAIGDGARHAGRHSRRRRFRRRLRRGAPRADRGRKGRPVRGLRRAGHGGDRRTRSRADRRVSETYERYRALYPAIRGGIVMSTGFFGDIESREIRGAGEHQSARLPLLRQGRGGRRQADGGPSALRRRLLALLRLAGRRSVRRPDLRAAVVRRRRWRGRS